MGNGIEPQIVNRFRTGDIRHCYADITRIQQTLGYEPKVRIEQGLANLLAWVRQQQATDRFEEARRELEARRLTK